MHSSYVREYLLPLLYYPQNGKVGYVSRGSGKPDLNVLRFLRSWIKGRHGT